MKTTQEVVTEMNQACIQAQALLDSQDEEEARNVIQQTMTELLADLNPTIWQETEKDPPAGPEKDGDKV